MITTTIHIDEQGYQGEDPDRTYRPGYGEKWYCFGDEELACIQLGHPPKQIEGVRCLKSEIERILRRIQDQQITPSTITISFK